MRPSTSSRQGSDRGECTPSGDWATAEACEYDAMLVRLAESISRMTEEVSNEMRDRLLDDV